MTTYTVRKANPASTRTDAVVIGVGRDGSGALAACPGAEEVAAAYGRRFAAMLSALGFRGEPGEVLRIPSNGTIRAAVLVVVGTGEVDALDPAAVRRAAGVAARSLGNAASVALALPAGDLPLLRAVAEGHICGGYAYTGHRSRRDHDRIADVVLLSPLARSRDATAAVSRAQLVGTLSDRARDWVNTPPNELTPAVFADEVVALAGQHHTRGLDVTVLDQDGLRDLGCGGILGVGSGSVNPPRLVRLTWRPRDAQHHVALVGKGVTYDSGGLSIKPIASMPTMKYDMAGAAAVVAATLAVAELDLPVAVTALAPMAENMVSGSSLRPGDVLTMYGGKTLEVTNTDAEGRLLLADAIGMAAEDEPDTMVEISTLTGPCVTALGDRVAGLFGDDEPVAAVRSAAAAAGERVWHMPLREATLEQVRSGSRIADVLQYNWVRWGSASFAAAVLMQFTRGVPFAHLDVAGPAYNKGAAWGEVPSGATGFGVATLVEYVERVAAG
ncbi:MAG: leucyl aminopeptidase [Marmoricola sp.]